MTSNRAHSPEGMPRPEPAWRGTPQPPWPGPRPAEPAQQQPQPDPPGDRRLALLSYLSVPFLGPCVPLVIFLLWKQRSGYVRRHSAQALNLSFTMILYGVCALIAGAILALDSVGAAFAVVVPLAAVLWLANVGYAFAAGLTADRGGFRRIPGWLCAAILR